MDCKRDAAEGKSTVQDACAAPAGVSSLRVLLLCHRIPYPPDKGDKIRSYHLLTFLAKRGAVDLVTHVDDPRDLRHVQLLEDLCRSVDVFPLNPLVGKARALMAVPGGGSLSVAYMTRPSASRRVRELLAKNDYDLVVGYSSQVAAYLPDDLDVPVVLDMVDVDSEKWSAYGAARGALRGFVSRLEGRRVRALEGRIGDRCARVVVTTPREASVFRDRVGIGEAVAIGNGVVSPDSAPPQVDRPGKLVVFVGTMDYDPNVEAVERVVQDIWPRVRAAHPDAVFRIVGRSPTPRVRALSAQGGVEVTGEVPDLKAHLEAASVALIPLRVARGIQNKVLEALAWGVPVVASTSVGACLHEEASAAVMTSDDDVVLGDEVARLLGDPSLRQERGEAGRWFVASHHDWSAVGAAWSAMIDEVCEARGAP